MPLPRILIFTFAFLLIVAFVLIFPEKGKKNLKTSSEASHRAIETSQVEQNSIENQEQESSFAFRIPSLSSDTELPQEVNQIAKLFQPFTPNLPIVETINYTTRTSWLAHRQAFLGDYAAHYATSKHFISRSLNGPGNYFSETVRQGDRFNVLCRDKSIEFHLVLDLSRLKLWFYAYDADEQTRYLLKSYSVCAGRLDPSSPSGSLTPQGIFLVGKDFVVYKEGILGTWRSEPKEMVTIFGLRWIGLGKEVADCSGSCKGIGLHGVPLVRKEDGTLVENRDCIGKYESEGCIRLLSADIEELYSIIVSRPTYVHIVQDFILAKLPGKRE